MRIVQLSEQEAANSVVMENVAKYLLTGEPAHIQQVAMRGIRDPGHVSKSPDLTTNAKIVEAHAAGKLDVSKPTEGLVVPPVGVHIPLPPTPIGVDAPDVGTETPVVPLASPFAHLGFGSGHVVPPVPSVPTAPAASAPTVGASLTHAGVDLDASGLYWDERIHSSSKDKNKDGTWRAKRGVDKALVPAVEAEIRAILAIPSGVPTPPAVPVPQPPAIPLPPAGTTVATTLVPTPPADEHAFTRWMEELAPDMAPNGRFTPALLDKLIAVQGLDPAIGLMIYTKRQDLVPAARAIVAGWMNDPTTVPQ